MRGAAAVLLLTMAGCGSGEDAPLDLAAPSAADLAAASDLAPGFCDNLRAVVAGNGAPGNCAVAFFAQLMTCFQPSGACAIGTIVPSHHTYACWANGADVEYHALLGANGYVFQMQDRNCGTRQLGVGLYGDYCVPTSSASCLSPPDGGYVKTGRYRDGVFTCPDGTAVDIGPDFGGCTELATRVNAYSQLCDGNGSTAPCTYHP